VAQETDGECIMENKASFLKALAVKEVICEPIRALVVS
jgi:hypothetical protein